MSNRLWLITGCATVFASAMLARWQSAPTVKAGVNDKGEEKSLKLIAEYRHNILEDLSSDGRLMLFYHTSTPTRTYSYRSDTDKVKPDQPEIYDDVLRVVGFDSRRELGRVGVSIDDLSHALVLLWLGQDTWTSRQLARAIGRLASNDVLNVTVAGKRPDEAFSVLLQTLGSLPSRKHTMTGVLKDTDVRDLGEDALIVKDAIEGFLIGTWPDDGRFDEWTQYRIIIVGDPRLAQQVRQTGLM